MTCAEAVRVKLLATTPVTALVNQRIWTFRWPQSPTKPAVLVQHISDLTDMQLRGTVGRKSTRIQVDVIGDTIDDARAVDAVIVGGFSGGTATGLAGFAGTVSGTFVILFAQPIGYHETYDGDELKQRRVSRDFRIVYEE